MLNFTFFVFFSVHASRELNGSNVTFPETDIVRNYGVDSTKRIRGPSFFILKFTFPA